MKRIISLPRRLLDWVIIMIKKMLLSIIGAFSKECAECGEPIYFWEDSLTTSPPASAYIHSMCWEDFSSFTLKEEPYASMIESYKKLLDRKSDVSKSEWKKFHRSCRNQKKKKPAA